MIYDISIPAGSSQFGVWLVTTLAKRDMRVDDLAFKMGVTPPTVKRWCQNPQSLKMIQIIEITNILVEDAVLWKVTFDKAVNLIVNQYNPNKSIKNYKNRRLPE